MKPRWFALENVPYESMWADDAYWWPHYLRSEKFKVDSEKSRLDWTWP